MKNKKVILLLVVVFVALLAGSGALYDQLSDEVSMDQLAGEMQEATEPTKGAQEEAQTFEAPDFTVLDAEGNAVKLSDFRGKPVVLNFWASWCGPCKSEMPDFEEVFSQQGEEVQFLMVNMTDGSRETVETASAFIKEQGYTFPVYYDTEFSAAIAYGVNAIPVTYFIDAEGILIAQGRSALDSATIQTGIDMITGE